VRPISGNVFSPAIAAGMEESNHLAATRIDAGDVGTHEAVATDASESEFLISVAPPCCRAMMRSIWMGLDETPMTIGNTHSMLVAKPGG
jgi:hypothetical protein